MATTVDSMMCNTAQQINNIIGNGNITVPIIIGFDRHQTKKGGGVFNEKIQCCVAIFLATFP